MDTANNNKKIFLDSNFGDDYIKKYNNEFSDEEMKKANAIIKYDIDRIIKNEIDFEEWCDMYDILYTAVPWQLFLDNLDIFAVLLYCVDIRINNNMEQDSYNKMFNKLREDLINSKMIDSIIRTRKKL